MKFDKYNKLLIILLIVILSTMTACSNKDSGTTPAQNSAQPSVQPSAAEKTNPPEEVKKEPVTIVLQQMFIGQYQQLFDKFSEKYPWITIKPYTEGYQMEKLVAGEPIDIVKIEAGLTDWLSNDLLEDLTPYMGRDERFKNTKVIDGFLESNKTGDKYYALPYSNIPMYIIVNKDLLKKYGMEMPSNDWTYEDFLTMAKSATDQAVNEYGISPDNVMGDQFPNIYAMANGSADNYFYFNKDMTQSLLHTPEVLADLKWVQELSTKWHVRPTIEERKKLGLQEENNFLTGKFLFMLGADWYIPGINENAKFEWDVLPMPRGKVKQATAHLMGTYSIPKSSKHKEEAFLFLSYMYDIEAQKWMIETGSNSFIVDPELDKYYGEVPVWKGKNVEAIKMTSNQCCMVSNNQIVDLSPLYTTYAPLREKIFNGGDLSTLIPGVEKYNKDALETRKKLGW